MPRISLHRERRGTRARRVERAAARLVPPTALRAPTLTYTRENHPNVSVLRKEEAKSKVLWKRGCQKRQLPAYFISVEPRGKDPIF